MGRNLSHAEVVELLGAYAIDAVDEDEREAVERHLKGCRSCWAEVSDHREAVASFTGTSHQAPEHVWERISDSLEGARSPRPLSAPVGGRMPAPVPPPAPVISLPPRRRAVGLGAVGIAAAVAASVIGLLSYKVVDDGRRIDRLEAGIDRNELARVADAAAADASAERVVLRSDDGLYSVESVLLPDGTGYLVKSNLPDLPSGRSYQLWAVVGGAKISIGVLGPSPGPAAFRVTAPVSALAITDEVAGGVTATERDPVVVGTLS